MMAQTPTQVIFYVYKNRPGASPESEYISEILRLVFEVEAKPCNSLCSPGGVSQFHYLQGVYHRVIHTVHAERTVAMQAQRLDIR